VSGPSLVAVPLFVSRVRLTAYASAVRRTTILREASEKNESKQFDEFGSE